MDKIWIAECSARYGEVQWQRFFSTQEKAEEFMETVKKSKMEDYDIYSEKLDAPEPIF